MVRTVVTAGAVALTVGLLAAAGAGWVPVTGPGGSGSSRAAEGGASGEAAGSGETSSGERASAGGVARVLAPPLDAPVVVAAPFDAPAQPWLPGHRGVDLAAHVGQLVRAPAAGTVTFSGTVVDRGVLTITHADGLRSSLEPVVPGVRVGQRVLPGQVVASVGAARGHCAPATCLHWGLRRGETYLDPMRWVLHRGPIVLLPDG